MQHQRVAVGIGEESHVTDTRVERLTVKLDPCLLEQAARLGDVGDAQRDRVLVGVELHPSLLGNHDRQRDVAGVELRPVLVRQLVPPEAELLAVELECSFLISRSQRHEIRPLDIDQPTDPSICSWINRFISTAYSSGSSLVIGSTKPDTISADASGSESPRDIR